MLAFASDALTPEAVSGHPALAKHVATGLVADEFDPTICQEMSVDHGVMSFMPMLTDTHWPVPIVPLAVNVIQHPVPTARRLYRLGAALRHAVESFGRFSLRQARIVKSP